MRAKWEISLYLKADVDRVITIILPSLDLSLDELAFLSFIIGIEFIVEVLLNDLLSPLLC